MITPVCLTIAGSDSGGEAGIQADLTTFHDFDCHGVSAITANTAQNPTKILSLNIVSPKCLKEQINALNNYFKLTHIKTGLIPNINSMEVILDLIPDESILISDPLIAATSGKTIMNTDTLQFFKNTFTNRIDFITPNLLEAEILLNSKFAPSDIKRLAQFARKGIYLKGGHSSNPGVDYFSDGEQTWELESSELKIKSSHGTGCRISSGLCAGLAIKKTPIEAAVAAKNYVFHTLKSCKEIEGSKWIMASPGNILTLENQVNIKEIE